MKNVDLSPYARGALREPIIRALELGTAQVKANLNAVGRNERGPWTVRVWRGGDRPQLVEHRGWDLEGLCFDALERFALGADTSDTDWRAGSDGLGHGHVKGRATWTLCKRPAVDERFKHPENSRCSACIRALETKAAVA